MKFVELDALVFHENEPDAYKININMDQVVTVEETPDCFEQREVFHFVMTNGQDYYALITPKLKKLLSEK